MDFIELSKDLDKVEQCLATNELDQAKDLLLKSKNNFDGFVKNLPEEVQKSGIKAMGKPEEEEYKTITVVNPPENRTTDSIIRFKLHGTFPQDCVVKWFFGDATPFCFWRAEL